MKTRNRTQAAFAQPESSWSRKRSERIVIRIQIQITKKKTSKATRSASPKLMSARNKAASFRSRWQGDRADRSATLPQRVGAAQPTMILPCITGWIVQW